MARSATYSLIASNTLGTAVSTVTLSSIPATFTDLILVCQLTSSGTTYSSIRFNGDTASNYSLTDGYAGNGSGITSSRQTNQSQSGAGASAGIGSVMHYQINDYSNATNYKTVIMRNANVTNNNVMSVGLWRNTAAINSITLITSTADNWSIGSTFKLYGIQAGNA